MIHEPHTVGRCRICGEWFCETTIIQDETFNTDVSDDEATFREEGWYYDEDENVVLCPDCYRDVSDAGYDAWAYEYYLEDNNLKAG